MWHYSCHFLTEHVKLFWHKVWEQSMTLTWPVSWGEWSSFQLWGNSSGLSTPTNTRTLGNNHSPWAQVVQAVLGVHVDQWDPGSDAERHIIKLLCITDNISLLWKVHFFQQSELKINKWRNTVVLFQASLDISLWNAHSGLTNHGSFHLVYNVALWGSQV